MSSGNEKGRGWWLARAVGVGIVLVFGEWGSSLAQTDAEHEAERTLSDLKINLTEGPNVAMPDIYKVPPKLFEQIVGGSPEWKLFYFCRNHTSDELKKIIHEQFATKLFDKKGKETKMVDYTVTSQPHTNQLIVRCPTQQDAEAVLEVLDLVDVPPIQVKIDCLISEVYADMTFDRETTVLLGSKNTPEGVKQVPIITTKEITNKNNRIRQGESLVIGGIRKNEEYGVVRGIPILKNDFRSVRT